MIKRKCAWCKSEMCFQPGDPVKKYCSKECSKQARMAEYNKEGLGPVMPPLDVNRISDEGILALIKAIVSKSSQDITKHKPGTLVRVQAENFFKSEHFCALTGLDGEAILRDLAKKPTKPDTRGRKGRGSGIPCPVQCVETGVVYGSIKEAAQVYACHPTCIQKVCDKKRWKAAGVHWRRVEVKNNE